VNFNVNFNFNVIMYSASVGEIKRALIISSCAVQLRKKNKTLLVEIQKKCIKYTNCILLIIYSVLQCKLLTMLALTLLL
jgi:hypothetical protein